MEKPSFNTQSQFSSQFLAEHSATPWLDKKSVELMLKWFDWVEKTLPSIKNYPEAFEAACAHTKLLIANEYIDALKDRVDILNNQFRSTYEANQRLLGLIEGREKLYQDGNDLNAMSIGISELKSLKIAELQETLKSVQTPHSN